MFYPLDLTYTRTLFNFPPNRQLKVSLLYQSKSSRSSSTRDGKDRRNRVIGHIVWASPLPQHRGRCAY